MGIEVTGHEAMMPGVSMLGVSMPGVSMPIQGSACQGSTRERVWGREHEAQGRTRGRYRAWERSMSARGLLGRGKGHRVK